MIHGMTGTLLDNCSELAAILQANSLISSLVTMGKVPKLVTEATSVGISRSGLFK